MSLACRYFASSEVIAAPLVIAQKDAPNIHATLMYQSASRTSQGGYPPPINRGFAPGSVDIKIQTMGTGRSARRCPAFDFNEGRGFPAGKGFRFQVSGFGLVVAPRG